MPKVYDEEIIVVVQGGGGSEDPDVEFIDSFDLSDSLSGTLGPINAEDSIDLSDAMASMDLDLADSFALEDVASSTLAATQQDSLEISDALLLEDLTVQDSIDVADTLASIQSTVQESFDLGDAVPAVLLDADAADSFDLSDTVSTTTIDADAPDSFDLSDLLIVTLDADAPDSFALADIATVAIDSDPPDSLAVSDITRAWVAITNPGRSGTPSTDLFQDSFVNEANPTATNGSAISLTVQPPGALGGQQRIAYFKVDLSKLANLVGDPDNTQGVGDLGLRIGISVGQNGAVQGTMRWSCGHTASDPFTEDSVNWNTRPTKLTNLVNNATFTVPASPTIAGRNLDLTTSQITTAIASGWLLYTFDIVDNLMSAHFIYSRERGTLAQRPTLQFFLKRG